MAKGEGTGKSKGEVGYGEGEVALGWDDDVLLDEAELTRRLTAVFEAPDYQPPRLPDVAVRVLELSREPDANLEDFTRLLERDALLAGQVMKLQSPIYAGQAAVRTLQQALARIGIKNLRDLVSAGRRPGDRRASSGEDRGLPAPACRHRLRRGPARARGRLRVDVRGPGVARAGLHGQPHGHRPQ